ncbi:MAG: hypothetical protein J5699_00795 [Bacteroidales bacterium]|nr:hypothetical protein [Bacteroidales bacterium]
MKLLKHIAAGIAAITILSSCSLLTGTASNATTSGSSTGSALAALYNIFKTTGGIDLSNLTNLINLGQILGNIGGLGNATASFTDQFSAGLIEGSANLVNKNNVASVLSGLKTLANIDTSAITSAASAAATGAPSALTSNSAGVSTTLSSLTSIFNALQ